MDMAALLVDLAEVLDLALAVPQGPFQTAMRYVMHEPRVGDLVVVLHVDHDVSQRVGTYRGRYCDLVPGEDGEIVRDAGVTIHTLDGREARWVNAYVVRVSDIYQAARERLDEARAVVNGKAAR